MSRRIKVIRFCLHCGKLLTGKGRREYCEEDPKCQSVKAEALRVYMHDYAKQHKPWLKKNKESVRSYRKRTKASVTKCPFCGISTVNHFACDDCISRRAGIDTMYQTVM